MTPDMTRIEAPWTSSEVEQLNKVQLRGANVHPFTCPNRSDDHGWIGSDNGSLVATVNGWICVFCDYTQDWAYAFMADSGPDSKWMFKIF